MSPRRLADRTTDEVRDLLARPPAVVLVPIGSLEPHGPHLPLGTDTLLAETSALRACHDLAERGVEAWTAPSVAYGVTDFAAGFAGAIGTTREALGATLRALATRFLADGWTHVCFVSHHLEPAHDAVVRAAVEGLATGSASVASPLSKRWARRLSDEFKRGACHAGRYETSLVLASGGDVRPVYRALPPIETSLSEEIAAGKTSFRAMGLDRAYAGAPGLATNEEGDALFDRHVEMIVTEILEGLEARASGGRAGAAAPSRTPSPPRTGSADGAVARAPRAPRPSPSADGPRTYAAKAEMDERAVALLTQMMERQAFRELAAARLFGVGLQYAPDLKSTRFMAWHIREETEHYEAVARMYKDFTGTSVEPAVHARLAERPPFAFAASWFELAMAQFLYDRGGFWQLREYETCSFLPYRRVVEKIVKEEAGHQRLGERIVVDLCRTGAYDDVKQPCFEKWLAQGLLSFGRPASEASRYAIAAGLKRRDAAAVMQDFVDDIKPAVKACGLAFPDPARLAVEVPAHLDWSLEGVDPAPAIGERADVGDPRSA